MQAWLMEALAIRLQHILLANDLRQCKAFTFGVILDQDVAADLRHRLFIPCLGRLQHCAAYSLLFSF